MLDQKNALIDGILMRQFFVSFPLSITQKLFLLNLVIFVVFIGMITVSNHKIKKLTTSIIMKEFDQVTQNAQIGRRLSELKSNTSLLVGTFYKNDMFLQNNGQQLLEDVKKLKNIKIHDQLKLAIKTFENELDSLLSQCQKVNQTAKNIYSLNSELSLYFKEMEKNISKNMVQAVSENKDVSSFMQWSSLIPTYREALLEVGIQFAIINPIHSSSADILPLLKELDNLYLRLHTLLASPPFIAKLGKNMMKQVNILKKLFIKFDEDTRKLRSEVRELNKAKEHAIYIMGRIDEQIISSAKIMREKNITEMRSYLKFVYALCGLTTVIFGGLTYLFFMLSFQKPMKQICQGIESIREGNWDTRIKLNRNDEWGRIEHAMNEMVLELDTSYSELYEKNSQLAEAHQELESYMKELTDEIAERKRVEDALRASKEKFQSLSDNAPDIIYTLGSDFTFTYINPACEKVLGYKSSEIKGKYFTDFVQKEDIKSYSRVFHDIRDSKKIIKNKDIMLVHKNNKCRIFNMSGAPNLDMNSEFSGIVGILKDITEYRQLQIQIQQAQQMESITTLAGGVAHDFNNLMMGIQGRVSLMLIKTNNSHDYFKYLKGIESDIKRAADMTQQLLGFKGKNRFNPALSNINDLVKKQNHMFNRAKKEILIQDIYEKNLWPVEVDPAQIEQAIMNLYINAWQAMPSGGTIYVRTKNVILDSSYANIFQVVHGKYIKISVTDTGIGMDEITRKRIFEPFFTTKEFGKGTGLGLFSAYNIIKNHGGFIHVYSELGKGSKFTIYLPAFSKEESQSVNLSSA